MYKSKKKTETQTPDCEGTFVDRKFWTVRIEPGEPQVLGGKHLPAGVMVMDNRGPGAIHVNTNYTGVEF